MDVCNYAGHHRQTHRLSEVACVCAILVERRFPVALVQQFVLCALKRGDPLQAIELLRVSASYEQGTPQSSFLGPWNAVSGFKILNHRSLTGSDAMGALAYLELGRSLAVSDDKTQSKAAYAAFLNLWKEADPDTPIFDAAKREYARL